MSAPPCGGGPRGRQPTPTRAVGGGRGREVEGGAWSGVGVCAGAFGARSLALRGGGVSGAVRRGGAGGGFWGGALGHGPGRQQKTGRSVGGIRTGPRGGFHHNPS